MVGNMIDMKKNVPKTAATDTQPNFITTTAQRIVLTNA